MAATRRLKRGWLERRATPVPGDVVACLYELGIQVLRVDGDEANGRCYMHFERVGKNDAHPSWSCNTETGLFGCFSCGWKGPFVLLVSDVLGCSWDDAVEWVRKRGGIERVNKILGRGKYVDELVPEREVPAYTEADLALFVTPPQEARRKRGLTREACEYFGILWDEKREMWITPIRDPAGRLLGWQEKNERYFRNRPAGLEKGRTLFGFHLLPPGCTALLIESPLDCARVRSVSLQDAHPVGGMGAEITDFQMQLLFDRCSRIILGLDNDKAGWQAMKQLKQRYSGMGRRLSFYNYGGSNVKDQGDSSGEEIRYGVRNALSPLRVRFPT